MTFSVPANMLIAGEYAVTVPGGFGLAAAIAPRAYAHVERAGHQPVDRANDLVSFVVRQRGGHADGPQADGAQTDGAQWTAQWPAQENALLAGLWRAYLAEGHVGMALRPDGESPVGEWPAGATIEIDTRAFFDATDGRKLGLGSSAAAAVLFVAALDALRGYPPQLEAPRARTLFCNRVVALYRSARGGRGSGYDIAASVHGGVGIYQSGPRTRWIALPEEDPTTRWGGTICTWSAGAPVDSGAAIGAFERWREADPRGAARFRRLSNRTVRALARSGRVETTAMLWRTAALAGEDLGQKIGVNAHLTVTTPAQLGGAPIKASGAGDERAIAFVAAGTVLPPGVRAITIEPTGLTVEEWST